MQNIIYATDDGNENILNSEEQQKIANNEESINELNKPTRKQEKEDDDNIVTDPEKKDTDKPERIPPDAEGDPEKDINKKKITQKKIKRNAGE